MTPKSIVTVPILYFTRNSTALILFSALLTIWFFVDRPQHDQVSVLKSAINESPRKSLTLRSQPDITLTNWRKVPLSMSNIDYAYCAEISGTRIIQAMLDSGKVKTLNERSLKELEAKGFVRITGGAVVNPEKSCLVQYVIEIDDGKTKKVFEVHTKTSTFIISDTYVRNIEHILVYCSMGQ